VNEKKRKRGTLYKGSIEFIPNDGADPFITKRSRGVCRVVCIRMCIAKEGEDQEGLRAIP